MHRIGMLARHGALTVTAVAGLALATPAAAGSVAPEAVLGVSPQRAQQALREHPLRLRSGTTIVAGAMSGEVIVINLWASWCRPCRKELPELDVLHAEIAPRGGRVLAVSIDESPETAERFIRRLGLELPVIQDGPNGLAQLLDVKAIPATIVLDRNGSIAWTTSGSDAASLEQLRRHVRQLLDAKPYLAESPEGARR